MHLLSWDNDNMSLMYSYYDTLYPQAPPHGRLPEYNDLYSVTLGVPHAPTHHVYHMYHYTPYNLRIYPSHPFNVVPKSHWKLKPHLPFLFVD